MNRKRVVNVPLEKAYPKHIEFNAEYVITWR